LVLITAAICTAGERSTLEGSLRTLVAQEGALSEFEVLVVDNSREDKGFVSGVSSAVARDTGVPVRCVRELQVGLGFARNAAIAAAGGEVVAFLDDDVVVDPHWATELATAYRETDAAAVGGKIEAIWGAPRPPWLGDELLGYLSILDYGPERTWCTNPGYPFGANISFRKETLLELGGFATSLGGGGAPTYLMDEIDVCRRLERAGGHILYAPTVKVGHIVPPSRLTRAFFMNRAVFLGRTTARMGCGGSVLSRQRLLKGLPAATWRVAAHGGRCLWFTVTRRERQLASEGRHLAWNLGWMWETILLAGRGH